MENPASKNNQFLNRIYQDIQDNLDKEHYTVDDLARNVGLSRSMLHRKLKKLTGKSAGTIIIEKRLETACDMLKNDDATISEIAYQVGFNSPSYFNKVFKKHFKVSPGDFKKEPEKYIQPGFKAGSRRSFSPLKIKKYIWLILIAGNILLIYLIINASQSVPFKERDWIVITDFDNQTGENIFDKSLNTAFTLSISQSRYVNVISRKRMLETLKRMKAGEEGFIDEETGREIALREGVNICVVPGISRIGSGYILTAKILDSQSGEILASEVIDAKNMDDIIKQLDNLARKIRQNLGESSYMISRQNMSLSKVTTSSLDALKQFSLGLDDHIHMNFEGARIHYENAIEIDSSFTAAKASLGNLLYEKFDRQKGVELFADVMESIDNLTLREKYSILSKYAANVENDLDKAIEYSNILLELYPDNSTGYNNLGWYYQLKKEYGKAIEAYKTAIQIDPYTMISYGGLIWIYQEYLAEIDSVKTWSRKLIDTDQENPWGYFYLGSAFAAQDSIEKAEKAFLKARDLDPDFKLNSYRLAHIYSCQKKYDKAIEIFKRLAESGKDEIAYYYIGINYSLLGEFQKAKNNFSFYLESAKEWIELYPDMPQTYIQMGLVLTRLGERESGWKTGQKALQIDSTVYFDFARLLAVQGKNTEALEELEKAVESGYRDLMWIKICPDLYSLHDEEQFKKLLNKYF